MTVMPLKLARAVSTLQAGGVIAYPTEAIWGFGCDPQNQWAVSRLLALKERSVDKGLILIAASVEQFSPYLEGLETALQRKFCAITARPTTWLVPANNNAPPWITGKNSSIALRVSTYQPVRDLCLAYGGPIVSTSANRAGRPPYPWPWSLRRLLGHGLDYILPGSLGDAVAPSEIRDLISDKVFRSA